ncbi:MAG: superoxide dismutase [Verrucomicrobia bacterium]|nr:superoxide dismutase [Verrucomicrobiota bacterium]
MKKLAALSICLAAFTMLKAENYSPKNYSNLIGMPGFSDSLLQMHFKLYEGYVKNANDLLAKLQTINDASSYEYGALKRRLGWEFDGMRLHELYFGNLGGNGVPDKKSSLYNALSTQFGSFESWKKDFIATGSMRGIGWAVLYFDPVQGRLINQWINEHDVGHLAGGTPILIMDVFEHAYMPQFGLDKAKYIAAFFANIEWKTVESRFSTVSTSAGEGAR